jgi:hypothetical protein
MEKEKLAGDREPVEVLKALAAATTQYYEASPDRLELARLRYQEALQDFNAAQSEKDS